MQFSDTVLSQKIESLQNDVRAWADAKKLWDDCSFTTYQDEFDDEPSAVSACVSVLILEGGLYGMFNAHMCADLDLIDEFDRFMKNTEFCYEPYNSNIICFYPSKEELNKQYRNYFEWLWISNLIKPDYTSLYQEIFEYFGNNIKNLQLIDWRKFEVLISEIFRNQGYRTLLGTGRNDEGVDLRIFQKDSIDSVVTLVQVKRYSDNNPIKLEAVAALTGCVYTEENASDGLFVSTSRFLPVAKRFAARKKSRIKLADAHDVVNWCKATGDLIINDTSAVSSNQHLLDLIARPSDGSLVGKIVVADVGYGMIANEFCIIIKDSPHVSLIMKVLVKRDYTDLPYKTRGFEVPLLSDGIIESSNETKVYRAKKYASKDGSVSFMANKKYYTLWNDLPKYFDHND